MMDELDSLLEALCRYPSTEQQAAKIFDRVLSQVVQRYHHSAFWGDRLLSLDKSAAFRDDEVFRAALAKANSDTGNNQYASPDGISWRYNTLIWAAQTCLMLPGDFVECGVYRGDMTWMVTRNVAVRGSGKTFYLYDTFSGFDPRYSSETDFSYAPHAFEAANKEYQAPGIEDHVRDRFRGDNYIVITKGVVPDVLHEIAPKRIAFLHLDMNSPRAEVGALEVLFERISPNGIIVFDDYGWKIFQPQKVAADEFMKARGQVILELPTGQGLMIKRV
jgi:O-methyltransferase